ncbi:tyrosine-type recombinase/integrase [Pelistega ratti]|uniref:tyrosine-type recombinase/integrase n=1 Tax=Pelistega ratti TaxID=2652177 RepID=UPI00135B2EA7
MKHFGFYDLKGKDATDMWLRGVPLKQIQVLGGHESIKTTEIYVKSRWIGTAKYQKERVSTTTYPIFTFIVDTV